jgi:hypothetical protein
MTAMPELGPVSQTLERELFTVIRQQGIVIWLDKDGAYTEYVDDLARRSETGEVPFPVLGFRGSFLELLLALESYGNGIERQPLLVHMPGFNEDTIRKTPVLELYKPGYRHRKALDTLIREAALSRVAPADIDAFLNERPSLTQADAWLAAAVSEATVGLAAVLDDLGPSILAQELGRRDSSLRVRVSSAEDLAILREYLHKLTGLDDAWLGAFGHDTHLSELDNLLGALGAWLLCVEYVHDLRRPPHLPVLAPLRALPAPVVSVCSSILTELRANHGDAYARLADEVESFLSAELKEMTPDDLGHIDTFREEENRVLHGAVEALRERAWARARGFCDARHGERSFWLQRDQTRRWAWSLVAEAAALGQTLTRHARPLAGARSLEHAVELYAAGAFEVDRAHRRFEQKRLTLLEPRLPHFGPLQEVVGSLRRMVRTWADTLCRDFTALCKEHGFLPNATLQQRTLFEQIVHPLTHGGEKVALFVIDAFRFEMATELVEELGSGGAMVKLEPRLAELPTITSVGMNALAPVSQAGRLVVAGEFAGFKTGEFTVRKPDERARAMGTRSAGKPALLITLAAVCDASTTALTRKIAPHGLIVVHSKEIDDAGEANMGLPTFESTLRQIRAAWHHLQLAGVKHFVFTADHGFLLQDETTDIRPFGTKRDPSRRHVVDDYPRAEPGMVPVSMSALGYDGIGGYLLVREDTAVFATGNPGATFVHGGNSPQERIIPVLTVTRKRPESAGLAEYMVEVESLQDVIGLHRIRVRVGFARNTPTALPFATARAVDVALRVPERPEIRAVIKDVSNPGELRNGRVRLPLGNAWSEVFFALEGPRDERVRIEVHHPDNIERVQSCTPGPWYSVSGGALMTGATGMTGATMTAPARSWADAIENTEFRRVFVHIEKHGVITEPEVTAMLGSPRSFRKFSLEFDRHVSKLPFRVRIEAGEGGKRYVREGDK